MMKKQNLQNRSVIDKPLPRAIENPFFGVGPITDMTCDDVDARLLRFEFEHWLEDNYRKIDHKGRDIGPFSFAELSKSMHRGYPADKIILDMMRTIHSYFNFPLQNRLAVGLGGGHSGFSACILHLMNTDKESHVFVDTPRPECEAALASGFFRQSWASQVLDLQRYSKNGSEEKIHFADMDGHIPTSQFLLQHNVKLFVGVGNETTGATTYSAHDIQNLLEWLAADRDNHHAIIDATSLVGAMVWGKELADAVTTQCCLFMPFQKAIGGIPGYFTASFTPQALKQIEENQKVPSWAIPRQLRLVAPVDAKKPTSGHYSVDIGPFYDASTDKMLGGVVNTFSTLAFAETTFNLLRTQKQIGSIDDMNVASIRNRDVIDDWIKKQSLFKLAVEDPQRRGGAVTIIKVDDPEVRDKATHKEILAATKRIIGYEGQLSADGSFHEGLDYARYINAFPGTLGDFRAWVSGIRPAEDIVALLDALSYAWKTAKKMTLERLAKPCTYGQKSETIATASTRALELMTKSAKNDVDEIRRAAETVAAISGGLSSASIHNKQQLKSRYDGALQNALQTLLKLVD